MEEKDKKQKNKSIAKIVITIIFILILIILLKNTYKKISQKKNFENGIISFAEKNKETIFTINKIVYFSSSDSKNKTTSTTNFTIQNLYTYTDIALFIENDKNKSTNNNKKEYTMENTLKKVKISNIKFSQKPTEGNPSIYYKSINNFAKSELEETNIIDKELEFEITSEDKADLSKPILYNNCANPITLSYINQNIKTDFTMTDTQNPITYNGSLLKRCGITIASINTSISFDIEIENNKNQKFKTTVILNIPYENAEKSIYDGNLTVKQDTKFDFYRYE